MKFRTETEISAGRFMIDPDRPIVFLGSCFASNMAKHMRDALCSRVTVNPTGALFNPCSVYNLVRAAVIMPDGADVVRALTFNNDGYFGNFLADTTFSNADRDKCEEKVLSSLQLLKEALDEAETLVVTLGTSWTYSLDSGYVVSNCHKLPAKMFTRRRLDVIDCYNTLADIRSIVKSINPDIRMLLTVSPVRHVKDGLHGNSVSKSILMIAADMFVDDFDDADYFPAYEILIDDLRDYRFYAEDLAHPSDMAVDYIWEKFQQAYFSKDSIRRLQEGRALRQRMDHRHLHPESAVAKAFDAETKRLVALFLAER